MIICENCIGTGLEWAGTYDQQEELCQECDGKGWGYSTLEEETDDFWLGEIQDYEEQSQEVGL